MFTFVTNNFCCTECFSRRRPQIYNYKSRNNLPINTKPNQYIGLEITGSQMTKSLFPPPADKGLTQRSTIANVAASLAERITAVSA